ncbi:chloramphenicol-sensitive protein RarD [Geomicrobium halophilum]|uniref:Chloramphenicol-sensitive protein RarD n=1 Tax=Geomicrobium halophilum TaxID=549000 RepID=A0A841PMD4_9BACL|nr:EamA family transporter RarD [Geomicrobium halophilum]MBB6450017.1 chloramphenicol-sensitive protein RarD [Geomicrobium halophilum]
MNEQNTAGAGVVAAVLAYLVWGMLPLYWKLAGEVPSAEVLAHRVIWSLIFMVLILILFGKIRIIITEIKQACFNKKTFFAIIAASVFISINWFVFIFAVNSDRVIEASLGYYINPLVNVLLAMVFLKERLLTLEKVAVLLAFIGVMIMTVYYGSFPWASFTLAISFASYGLIKKIVPIGAWAGLTIETLLMTPFALLFLIWIHSFSGVGGSFALTNLDISLILIGGGIATAVPLLLFATGARRITFSLIGILQYIAPTMMLILGVFVFHEPFGSIQLLSFCLIWVGLVLFTTVRSRSTFLIRRKNRLQERSLS